LQRLTERERALADAERAHLARRARGRRPPRRLATLAGRAEALRSKSAATAEESSGCPGAGRGAGPYEAAESELSVLQADVRRAG